MRQENFSNPDPSREPPIGRQHRAMRGRAGGPSAVSMQLITFAGLADPSVHAPTVLDFWCPGLCSYRRNPTPATLASDREFPLHELGNRSIGRSVGGQHARPSATWSGVQDEAVRAVAARWLFPRHLQLCARQRRAPPVPWVPHVLPASPWYK